MEFKGTKAKWIFRKATEKFDSFTISESGKIIGYSAKNSEQDIYNELCRSKASELLIALSITTNHLRAFGIYTEQIEINEQLIKEATEL